MPQDYVLQHTIQKEKERRTRKERKREVKKKEEKKNITTSDITGRAKQVRLTDGTEDTSGAPGVNYKRGGKVQGMQVIVSHYFTSGWRQNTSITDSVASK